MIYPALQSYGTFTNFVAWKFGSAVTFIFVSGS